RRGAKARAQVSSACASSAGNDEQEMGVAHDFPPTPHTRTPKLLSSAQVNDVWGTFACVTHTTPEPRIARTKIPQRALQSALAASTFLKDVGAPSSNTSSRSSVAGKRSAKTLPPPRRREYVTSPPWISASVRAIDNPRPARPASGVAFFAR